MNAAPPPSAREALDSGGFAKVLWRVAPLLPVPAAPAIGGSASSIMTAGPPPSSCSTSTTKNAMSPSSVRKAQASG
eukprot:2453480-Prorocentrum_lima.AAC.1